MARMDISYCLLCDFTNPVRHTIIAQNDIAYSSWDPNPVTKGHAIIVPKKHIVSFFNLSDEELTSLYAIAKSTQETILTEHNPDGFNIGINDGEAAGRSVHHLHVHIIPRYTGDVENPRGGVRHIIPGKGSY